VVVVVVVDPLLPLVVVVVVGLLLLLVPLPRLLLWAVFSVTLVRMTCCVKQAASPKYVK
jgi:hypothetical protein